MGEMINFLIKSRPEEVKLFNNNSSARHSDDFNSLICCILDENRTFIEIVEHNVLETCFSLNF